MYRIKHHEDQQPGSSPRQHPSKEVAPAAGSGSTSSTCTSDSKMIPQKTLIRRASTSTTWALSSTSSSSLSPSLRSSHHRRQSPHNRRRSRVDGYPDTIDHDGGEEADDFATLSRLSLNYRDGCLSLDEDETLPHLQGSSTSGMVGPGKNSRSYAKNLESFVASLEALEGPTNRSATSSPPTRQPEPMTDADRKPAAKKTPIPHPFHRHSNQKNPPPPASPSLLVAASHAQYHTPFFQPAGGAAFVPPSRSHQLRDDPLHDACSVGGGVAKMLRNQQAILDAIEAERSSHIMPHIATVSPPPSASSRARPPRYHHHHGDLQRLPPPSQQGCTSSRPQQASASASIASTGPPSQRRGSNSTSGSSKAPSSSKTTRSSSSNTSMVDDHVASLGNGKKIRLKGTKHAYKSIRQGQATIVQCPSCRMMLQISASAKNLYCTACQQVSPINIDDTMMSSRICSQGLDNQIARALQRQEIHVSQIVKLSK